jgi:hypothetical protein
MNSFQGPGSSINQRIQFIFWPVRNGAGAAVPATTAISSCYYYDLYYCSHSSTWMYSSRAAIVQYSVIFNVVLELEKPIVMTHGLALLLLDLFLRLLLHVAAAW